MIINSLYYTLSIIVQYMYTFRYKCECILSMGREIWMYEFPLNLIISQEMNFKATNKQNIQTVAVQIGF